MIKSITSVKLSGRRVIARVGFDVPLKRNIHSEQLEVADDSRIRDVLPTLKYLMEQRAKIILISHLDRPQGWEEEKSLWPAAEKLAELINYKPVRIQDRLPDYAAPHVNFLAEDITKQDYSKLSRDLPDGQILFLENLRFYPGEKDNDQKFAEILASFGNVYVDEAFSDAHRKAASNSALAKLLPAYGGVSFLKEIFSLQKIIRAPKQPLIVLLGGAKIDDKIETLNNLAPHADRILAGGEIANTFFAALGYEVGKSKVSNISLAREILRNYKQKIVLPSDIVVAEEIGGKSKLTKPEKVLPNQYILDIGPDSIRKFSAIMNQARTLVWNGPFGLIENPKYAFGSKSLAQVFAARSKGKAFGLIGGGETVEVVNQAKVSEFIDHVSMAGGAMLEFLAGKQLPAIKALDNGK